jgi:hypothetical protein
MPGGSVGTRVRKIGFLRGGLTNGEVTTASCTRRIDWLERPWFLLRRKDCGPTAQAAIVVDHAEAARKTNLRVSYCAT